MARGQGLWDTRYDDFEGSLSDVQHKGQTLATNYCQDVFSPIDRDLPAVGGTCNQDCDVLRTRPQHVMAGSLQRRGHLGVPPSILPEYGSLTAILKLSYSKAAQYQS